MLLARAPPAPRPEPGRRHASGGRPGPTHSTAAHPAPPAASSSDAPSPPITITPDLELPPTPDAAVAAALAAAAAAAAAAEAGLDAIPNLPSARLPFVWPPWLLALLRAVRLAAIGAGVLACQPWGVGPRAAAGLAVAAAAGARGLRSRSLSAGGAAAATLLGGLTLASSFRLGAAVLVFYGAGSALTRLGEERKALADASHKAGGQRDGWQVAAAAAAPAALALAAAVLAGRAGGAWSADFLPGAAAAAPPAAAAAAVGGALGWVAAACGDTFSSELGSLSDSTPRLITSGRPVRAGTNGGVTLAGLGGAVAGGLVAGGAFWGASAALAALLAGPSAAAPAAAAVATALAAPALGGGVALGLAGSLLDSLLGATLQFSGVERATDKIVSAPGPGVVRIAGQPFLSNAGVNAVSAGVVAVMGAVWLGGKLV